jgi:hypothetical protein
MATTVSSTAPSNQKLEKIFPTLVDDFKQIAGNFTKLVKLRREENLNVLREKYRVRQISYKSRFSTKVEKKYESKPISEQTSGFLSLIKGVGGALGATFLILGVAGIAKMILSSSAGSYIGKFIVAAFQSALDLFKKVVSFLKDILNSSEVKDAFIKAFGSLFQLVGTFLSKSFEIVKSLFNDREIRDAIIKTVIALFTAITSAIQASYNVIQNIFDSDINSIKTNLINLFSKLTDVLVNVLSITGNLFQSLVNNSGFMQGLKNIFTNLVELVVEAFKYDYVNTKTGERVNIMQEVGLIIAEAATLFAASKLLKGKLLIAAAEMTAFREKGGVPLPGGGDGKDKSGRGSNVGNAAGYNVAGRGIRKVGEQRLAQMAAVRATKATVKDKILYAIGKNWNKLTLLFDKLMYSKFARNKFIDVVVRLAYRYRYKFGYRAVAAVCTTLLASVATASTGIGAFFSLAMLILNLYLGYEIMMFIIEYSKEILDELEKDEKEETAPKPTTDATQGQVVEQTPTATQADVRRIDNEIEKSSSTTTTTAAAINTTPTQINEKQNVIYTVGDSHSNGISNYGKRKGFIAKGKDGSPSTAKMHLDAINSIPEGSDVVISLGANDLAGGRKISSIVGSVTSVIAAAQKRRLNVTYLLPTLPASNKPYDPRRVELREALKMAVKVPIIDLGQASTTDKLGVHLDPAGYAQMAGKVSQSFKSSTSVSTTTSTSNLPTENLNNVPENLQNFIQNSSDTLTNVIKDLNQKSQGNSEAEKKTTLAGMLISQLSTQLKALDEMTGGKLGASSGEVSEALRYLEDEFNQGTSIFDLSTKTAVHKTETTVNTPPNIQKTNQNILNAILKRHYT